MVNNQIEFNNKYNIKEKVKEIEIKHQDFQGPLIIEDYPELEEIYFHDVSSIEEINLRNLSKLKECTIQSCGATDLAIENCPRVTKLNVQSNFLTSLEFLANLENLENLEARGNDKLVEILKFYNNDWRACRVVELAKQKPHELLRMIQNSKKSQAEFSQQKYNALKRSLASFSKEMQEQILEKEVSELDNEIKAVEIKTQELTTLKTGELTDGMKANIEKLKGWKKQKQSELCDLRNKNQELEEGLIREKKEQLEKMKNEFIEKKIGFLNSSKEKEKIRGNLKIYLDSVKRQNDNEFKFAGEKAKEWLLKREKENSELTKLLNELCQKQKEITLLEGVKVVQETQISIKEISNESESKKAVDLQVKRDKVQFGIPTPWGVIGTHWEKDRTHLAISEQYLEQNKEIVTELGQKLVDQLLEIQKTEEQSQQQSEIQISPK